MTDTPLDAEPKPLRGILGTIERIGNKLPDPVMIFVYLIGLVFVLSAVAAAFGWHAVNPVTQERVAAESLLTSENLRRLMVEAPRTLTGFAPLGFVLTVMLGAGVAERSGFFAAALKAAVKDAPKVFLTPILVIVGIVGHSAADAAFVVVVPLGGIVFAAAGRHPIAGIAAAFAGVGGGFSANFIPGQLDALLLGITQTGAQLLDPSWTANIAGNWYYIAAMAFMITPIAWIITDLLIEPRLGKWQGEGAAESEKAITPEQARGLRWAGVAALAVVVFFTAMTLPQVWAGAEGGAPLFDEGQARLERALAPFFQSLVFIFLVLFLAVGAAYGAAAGTVKSHRDVVRMMTAAMQDMGFYVVLAFAAAHFVALFDWSNLGVITAIRGADVLRATGLPAPLLIGAIVLLAAVLDLFIGSASAKWTMLAPVLVPMLMLLGISPEMTTAAYRMGDSVSNIVTPLMVYFPLALLFCRRWVPEFGLGSLMASMAPYTFWFLLAGLAMTMSWVALDWPLGPGAGVTYTLPAAPTP